MSLSGSLSSALSGMNAASRTAQVVSANIANATTQGYARREIQTASLVLGGEGSGVRITGVVRHDTPVLTADRRLADAGSGNRGATAAFYTKLESILGASEDPGALMNRIGAFDTALLEAAARPDSDARLANVLQTAKNLSSSISNAARDVQASRVVADREISAQVSTLNAALVRVGALNEQILNNNASGRDSSGLQDLRQQTIDSISKIVPLRELRRDGGAIALYAATGAPLVDGFVSTFEFQPTPTIVAGMTQTSGGVGGLKLNGQPVDTRTETGAIAGGTLAAQFNIRDELAPEAQRELDGLARDLIERFANPTVDATRAPGAPGLFTDQQTALLPSKELGLAQRLVVNSRADPDLGGAYWRLREGLGSTTPGAVGNSSLLTQLNTALNTAVNPSSVALPIGARSFSSIAAEVRSDASTYRVNLENEATFQSAQLAALTEMEKAEGVDTDQEMQTLLQVEQAYSANVRVIQVVNDMMQTLLEI